MQYEYFFWELQYLFLQFAVSTVQQDSETV